MCQKPWTIQRIQLVDAHFVQQLYQILRCNFSQKHSWLRLKKSIFFYNTTTKNKKHPQIIIQCSYMSIEHTLNYIFVKRSIALFNQNIMPFLNSNFIWINICTRENPQSSAAFWRIEVNSLTFPLSSILFVIIQWTLLYNTIRLRLINSWFLMAELVGFRLVFKNKKTCFLTYLL